MERIKRIGSASTVELNHDKAPAQAAPRVLVCKGLSFAYGSRPVLQDIDLELERGQIGVIFGRSASGKTTLLRCITGYLQSSRGVVDLSGARRPVSGRIIKSTNDLTSLGARSERLLALWGRLETARRLPCSRLRRLIYGQCADALMMFANNANTLSQLTAEENLYFALAPSCPDLMLRHELVCVMLEIVGLCSAGKQRPAELSSGQQRRLSLAQAIIGNPAFLALDEPTTGLDTGTRFEIIELIQALHGAVGLSGLMVTHDIDTTLLLADVVFFMHGGRIVSSMHLPMPRPRHPEHLEIPGFVRARGELVRFVAEKLPEELPR